MKRWAWNIFCALSLLIFATSVTLWVRSYFACEIITIGHGWNDNKHQPAVRRGATWGCQWTCGTVIVDRLAEDGSVMDYEHIALRYERRRPAKFNPLSTSVWGEPSLQFAGFHWLLARSNYTGTRESEARAAAPLWLFLIFALPPLVWWRQSRKAGGRGFPLRGEQEASAAADSGLNHQDRQDHQGAAQVQSATNRPASS